MIKTHMTPLYDQTLKAVPMGRMGAGEEVAKAIAFMASPACPFMTGTNVVIDGGVDQARPVLRARPCPSIVKKRIDVVLVAGGKYHDIDFARLELLKLLAEDDRMRVRVFEDYTNLAAHQGRGRPRHLHLRRHPAAARAGGAADWVKAGGRWYALHGTNSILRCLPNGLVDSPRWAPHFMETLGLAVHRPSADRALPRRSSPTRRHPLVKGVEPFDATDELYLVENHGELHVLLETEFGGEATGFVEHDWPKASTPSSTFTCRQRARCSTSRSATAAATTT